MRNGEAGTAAWAGILLALVLTPLVYADEKPSELLTSDSRAPYVHRITLYDHDGAAIDPTDPLAGPYSPRATCGKCHPYAEIAHGWHFNASDPTVAPGRPGEPWFLVDEKAGTQLPFSGRKWPGVSNLADAGLTHWQFVKRFGHHTPGGGFGEPSDEIIKTSAEKLRWGISGKLEIDCLFCHSADQQHDPAEAARQIEAENFKWAPTAALGLAVVRGEARKAPDDWDPMMPPNPDFPEQAGPKLVWDLRKFDPDGRVFFNVTARVPSERCYFCHSFREVGSDAADDLVASRDVHLAAGLLCVDCHRNELDHNIVRGYRTEALERNDVAVAAFSCEGCHLGIPGAADPEIARGGRYGAPRPEHRGLPVVHFEKLSCTACHSGPWPGEFPRRYQTALAHGLGLATRERTDDTPPQIAGPVFVEQPDAKIAPQKRAWGAYPLPKQEGSSASIGAAAPQRGAYHWAIAHDVRPAAQSLGINGCTDCHVAAPIVFGQTGSRDELVPPAAASMAELRGDSLLLARAWDFGFRTRTIFKWFAFLCAGVITLVLLRTAADVLTARGPAATVSCPPPVRTLGGLAQVAALLGFLILAVTGFGSYWLYGAIEGWSLFAHMLGAPLFVIGLTGIVLLSPWCCRTGSGGDSCSPRCVLFSIAIVLAYVVMMSMLLAMLPVFGTAGQEILNEVHLYSALLLLVALLAFAVATLVARPARRPKP